MKIGKDYIGVGVGAFILNENNELLLQKRAVPAEKDHWCIPGGRLEMFEKLEDAVIRETKEETDLDIEVIKLIGVCDHIIEDENSHWVATSYLCKIKSGTPKIMEPDKASDLKWFDLENLPDKLTITTKKALEDYSELINKNKIKGSKKMSKEEIINIVKEYVKNICKDDATGHDWWHIQRVYNNAMLINQKENADKFVITLIVLMHDLYDHKFYKGNVEEKLKETLKELNIYNYVQENDIENIINSCVNLGFSANMTTKKELSIEGKIAQDADRLDALGAIGIARTFRYDGKKEKPMYDPDNNELVDEEEYKQNGSKTTISHFYDKLLKVKDLMNTETAKLIAQERHQYLENFLDEFFDEWNGRK